MQPSALALPLRCVDMLTGTTLLQMGGKLTVACDWIVLRKHELYLPYRLDIFHLLPRNC